MNGKVKTIVCWALFILCIFLAWRIYAGIMQPVNFNKEKAARETVAIQRLKDIRTLQVAYKSANGRYVSTLDSLKDFYENGKMKIVMQVGSSDDSLAVAHTKNVLKGRKLTGEQLYQLYTAGDTLLVFSKETFIPVRDTIFASRANFAIDSILYIPFSNGTRVEMNTIIKEVSGVQVPLFEAKMSYRELLKGMNNQLRINLDAERRDQNKFEGLQVGSITSPNNNAGNWE